MAKKDVDKNSLVAQKFRILYEFFLVCANMFYLHFLDVCGNVLKKKNMKHQKQYKIFLNAFENPFVFQKFLDL